MPTIAEKPIFQPATVVYFDSRRGTGRCTLWTGRRARIPLSAMREARLITLDQGDSIFVSLDELDKGRVEVLRLPAPAPVEEKPVKKKKK
jgi:hypothetical protein